MDLQLLTLVDPYQALDGLMDRSLAGCDDQLGVRALAAEFCLRQDEWAAAAVFEIAEQNGWVRDDQRWSIVESWIRFNDPGPARTGVAASVLDEVDRGLAAADKRAESLECTIAEAERARAAQDHVLAATIVRRVRAHEQREFKSWLHALAANVQLPSSPPPLPAAIAKLYPIRSCTDEAELIAAAREARRGDSPRIAAWTAIRCLALRRFPAPLLQLAAAYRRFAASDASLALADEASRLDPSNRAADVVKMAALADLNRIPDALEFGRALGGSAMYGNSHLWAAWGRVLSLAEQFDAADHAFRAAFAASKDDRTRSRVSKLWDWHSTGQRNLLAGDRS